LDLEGVYCDTVMENYEPEEACNGEIEYALERV
jgi:hypothetical protein